ncbi:MAG: ABC transporter permease [Clostridiales bacterium]|nr:ABC transporter permease [Clostridiales bacterium]
MNNRHSFLQRDGVKTILASLLSILVGVLAGIIVIAIVGLTNGSIATSNIWDAIRLVVLGVFNKGRDAATGSLMFGFNPTFFGNMLFRAMPLILTGLSVAVAYKTGLFNIGAPGQYLAGTCASLFLALSIPTSVIPAWLVWIIAFFGGMIAGALWGCIPGLLKSLLNINEVIACIMTNWLAASLVTWIFDISNLKNVLEGTKTGYIYKTSTIINDVVVDGVRTVAGTNIPEGAEMIATRGGVATSKMGLDKIFTGSQVNGGIIIAILMAVIFYIIMEKTTLGYQLKACGSNRHAAKYAGIKDKRNIVLSMALAGGLAGTAGALYSLSGNTEFFWTTYQSLPAVGFTGIAVALLAVNNPIGVIFSGIFMSLLNINGQQLTNLTAYNEYITDVIVAVIVYLSAFMLIIKTWISRKRKTKPKVVSTEAEKKTEEVHG